MRQPRVFLSSVFDDSLRAPLFARCPGLMWLAKPLSAAELKDRSIEDVCRDLIRRSKLFVGLFGARGGKTLAFAEVATPVTVLEIELMQALFQRMPIRLFLFPDFANSARLHGIVDLAKRWRMASVRRATYAETEPDRPRLSSASLDDIARLVRRVAFVQLRSACSKLAWMFRRTDNLEIEFLDGEFQHFADTFDTKETERLIEAAGKQQDHAARLAMLWAAMRQLCAVPYTEGAFRPARRLWEKALSEWVRSAAWYGLHNDSPIGLLAAVNSIIRIRAEPDGASIPESSPIYIHGSRGARASALYSMAKRSLWLSHRWSLLSEALHDVQLAIRSRPNDISGYLAIRGSIYRLRGQVFQATRDHEQVVALRRSAGPAGLGEAMTELGWTYAWTGRLRKAKRFLMQGITLFQNVPVVDPQQAGFLVRALRKCGAVQALTGDFVGARHSMAEARRLATKYLIPDQVKIRNTGSPEDA